MCRQHILYPFRLEPLYPNDIRTLRLKVGLEPNQMKIDLRKVFMENIIIFWNIKLFLERKATKILRHAHTYTCMRTHAQALRTHAHYMYAHTQACTCMLGFQKL